MSHIDDPAIQSDIASHSCESLAARFSEGPWNVDGNAGFSAPTDTLRVVALLINVERGTLYGLEPVHLAQFRDRPFHVPPHTKFGLDDVYDDGTAAGETTSLVCDDECKLEAWADPRDAVASVFLAVARAADYVTNPDIGASSSFVVLNPMHPYYAEGEFPPHDTGLYFTDSDTGLINDFLCSPIPTRPIDICPQATDLTEPETLNSFTMVLDEQPTRFPKPVPILGIPGDYPINDSSIPSGLDRLISGSAIVAFLNFNNPTLFSNDQTAYFGVPSIVIGFTEFINGQLLSPEGERVRANYGTSALGQTVTSLPEL